MNYQLMETANRWKIALRSIKGELLIIGMIVVSIVLINTPKLLFEEKSTPTKEINCNSPLRYKKHALITQAPFLNSSIQPRYTLAYKRFLPKTKATCVSLVMAPPTLPIQRH